VVQTSFDARALRPARQTISPFQAATWRAIQPFDAIRRSVEIGAEKEMTDADFNPSRFLVREGSSPAAGWCGIESPAAQPKHDTA